MLGRIGQANGGTGSDSGVAHDAASASARAETPSRRIRRFAAPVRLPAWLKAIGRVTLRITIVVAPIALLGVGLLYLRLLNGPISLSFMVEPIQRVLNEEMPGIQFRVEDAILQLTSGGAIELRLTTVRVTEDSGSLVALASHASVRLSMPALRTGRIAPSRIDLLRPRVVLFSSDRPSYLLGYGRDLQGRTLSMPPLALERPVASPSGETEVAKTVTIMRDRIDAARRLAEVAAHMRQRKGAASYLETLGLKDASLVMSDDGQQTVLLVPSLELSMRHTSRRSIVEGMGTVAAGGGAPFTYRFRTEDSERHDRMTLTVDVEELVPRALAVGQPGLNLFEGVELPITGTGTIEMSRQGDVIRGTFDLAIGAGRAHLPWLGKVPLELSGGAVKATYAGDTRRLVIEPSTVRWRSSHATIKGLVEPATGNDGAAGWRFEVDGVEGRLSADELSAPPLPLDKLAVRGVAFPGSGQVEVSQFAMKAGPAEVAMSGTVAASGQTRSSRLDGSIGPMPLEALKVMWPQGLAPQTRDWVASHIVTGRVTGGSFSLINQQQHEIREPRGAAPSRQDRVLAFDLGVEQVGIEYLKGMPLLEAASARLNVEGTTATISIPAAIVRVAPAQQLALQEGRLIVSGVDQQRPLARVEARLAGPAGALIDLLGRKPLGLLRNTVVEASGFDGKLDARINVSFPIHDGLSMKDVQVVEAKASIVEGHARKIMGRYTVSGASIRAEARDNIIDVAGEALLEGVLTRLSWRHALAADPKEMQSLRLRTTLGNSERAQLGINLGELVSGDVLLDLTVQPGDDEGPTVRAAVDLSAAEINLSEVAWTKPLGQRADLRFDLGKRRDGNMVLQNFKLDADTLGINGWVALGPDNKPVEYLFTDMSINTVSNLTVRGVFRPDRVWEIKANGPRFDARDIFRGFLNVGAAKRRESTPPRSAGVDIEASIDTVSGVPDTSSLAALDPLLRRVQLRMSRRGYDLQDLQFSGTHDNGRLLKASLKASSGAPRILVVDAEDAGESLKLIGIYRHMQGGDGRLEINLDGAGAAERRGSLNIRHFKVMGDQVVSDVVYAYDEGQPAIQQGRPPPKRVIREQIEFDRLRTTFATGSGQLVIENMEVTGPVLSATLRGTLDYRQRFVQLGGTYTPLSVLNRVLSNVPLVGEVFTGPRREGVVAMTFAIQGPMANPQVIPNPLSLMTPGFLREIFQMAPNNPTVTPDRQPANAKRPPQPQTTASPPATGPSPTPDAAKETAKAPRARARSKAVTPEVTDGWAATTDPRAKPSERN